MCTYVKIADTIAIVAVYVDDLILIARTPEEMQEIKASLATHFKMNMGKLHYCLGITVEQDEEQKCLWIHQKQYILSMLTKYKMAESKTVTTPADFSVKLENVMILAKM